jgi:predicted RNase H-like nuclease (RuvC/YqgF family)
MNIASLSKSALHSKTQLALIILMATFCATPALAQYQWRDANGQMIISDQPPPANIKPSQIIKSAPMPAPAPKAEAKEPAKDSKQAATKAPMTTAEKEADFQKRRKELAESQKTGAEKQAAAEQKAKHCDALQQKLRTLSSGMRISNVQKNGEVAAMEGAEREIEMSKTSKEIEKSECST